jgi:hypothetical protein
MAAGGGASSGPRLPGVIERTSVFGEGCVLWAPVSDATGPHVHPRPGVFAGVRMRTPPDAPRRGGRVCPLAYAWARGLTPQSPDPTPRTQTLFDSAVSGRARTSRHGAQTPRAEPDPFR